MVVPNALLNLVLQIFVDLGDSIFHTHNQCFEVFNVHIGTLQMQLTL